MKKILFSSMMVMLFSAFMSASVPAFAQTARDTLTCTPVQQFAKDRTQIECRITSFQSEAPQFLVAELTFPFHVTRLIKVSSSFSATIGSVYPSSLVNNTVSLAAVEWGDAGSAAELRPILIDSLSFLLETDQTMSEVKKAFALSAITKMAVMSPFNYDAANPVFLTVDLNQVITFDNSLILESITQYVSPSVLQFLRLGIACYEKTAQQCFDGILQNL